jgi:hypothetical protein
MKRFFSVPACLSQANSSVQTPQVSFRDFGQDFRLFFFWLFVSFISFLPFFNPSSSSKFPIPIVKKAQCVLVNGQPETSGV